GSMVQATKKRRAPSRRPPKARLRKPAAPKRRRAAGTTRGKAAAGAAAAELQHQLEQRTRELAELLEQQTAMSEVLQIISSSPGDLEPVFASILRSAARICDANFGNIFRWDGEVLHLAATYNTPPA